MQHNTKQSIRDFLQGIFCISYSHFPFFQPPLWIKFLYHSKTQQPSHYACSVQLLATRLLFNRASFSMKTNQWMNGQEKKLDKMVLFGTRLIQPSAYESYYNEVKLVKIFQLQVLCLPKQGSTSLAFFSDTKFLFLG